LNSTKIQKKTSGRKVGRGAGLRKRRRLGWLGRCVFTGCVLATGLLAWAAIARALAPTGNTTQDHFDVLIVLGYTADADGNPTPTEFARVSEAVHEYERGVAPRIIFTGGAAHNRFVEAQVMARTAEAQGIPAAVIVEEPQAQNTIENACNSVRIMRNHRWESAEVVSSADHLPRAGLIFSRLPLKWRVHAAPALEPEGPGTVVAASAIEILKMVHYLVWSRYTEPCEL